MLTKEIITFDVPNAPEISGLRFRRYLGETDNLAFMEIRNAANRADNVQEYQTIEEVNTAYKTLRNTDMVKDIYIAEVDGEMVGFGRTSWGVVESENMYRYFNSFIVHPEWREKGIGRAIQPVMEQRLLELSQQHSDDAKKYMETWNGETEVSKTNLVKRFGYQPARYFFEMKRDLNETLSEAQMPAGLEIRPVTPDHYESIFYGDNEIFRDHWGHEDAKDGDFERWLKEVETIPAYNPENWVIAWDGDEMAGLLLTGIHEESNEELGLNEGWMHVIGVRRPWRKLGLASALIAESMQRFKALGLDTAALGVDTDNSTGALGLYTRHGFKQTDKFTSWRKEIR